MAKRFDADTLKKLSQISETDRREPANGTSNPSRDKVREAVREANDPKRLVTISPKYCASN